MIKKNNAYTSTSIYLPSFFKVNIENEEDSKNSKQLLNWFLVILMTSALAQPITKVKKQINPDSLRDIIFVIDTSVGMSLSDYVLNKTPVDRISLLKAVLADFAGNLEGNRIGLMVYADKAFTLTPLTRDKNLISHSISRIQLAIAGRQNNLSNALNTVLHQFDFKNKPPSIVVLSQGANIESDISPLVIAEKFQSKKIKLHIVGLGSKKLSDDTSNKLIFDAIDDELLRKLAEITGGEFYWAGKSNNLNSILNEIMKSETINVKKSEYYLIENYYAIILYLVLFFLMLSLAKNAVIKRIK